MANEQTDGAVFVVAEFTAKPGKFEAFLRFIEADAEGAHKEPGCLRFEAVQDSQQPDTLVLVEVYRDQVAFDSHAQSAHFQNFVKGTRDLIQSEQIRVFDRQIIALP